MDKDNLVEFSHRMPRSVVERLDKISNEIGITRRALINMICYDYANKHDVKNITK